MNGMPELGRFGNELLAALPDAVKALLKPHMSSAALAQGDVCFDAGDVADRAYFPRSGLISLLASTGSDDLVEAGLVGTEGAVGLQSAVWSRPAFARAVVQIPGVFWSVPAEPLRQAVQGSDEAKALVGGYTEILWSEAQQLAACNAVHHASRRLARWLLQAADRSQSSHLPFTQEFMADMLGVRRTSVTLLAQQLQERGLIRYNRADIVILDRTQLEAAACECYQIIRRLYPGSS